MALQSNCHSWWLITTISIELILNLPGSGTVMMCPKKLVRQSDEPGHLTGNPETAQTTWANKLVLKQGLKTLAQKVLNLNIMPFWAEEVHNEKRIFSCKKLCSIMSCHKTVNIIGSNDSTTARTASWVVLVVERTECAWMTTIIATLSASVDTTGLNVAFFAAISSVKRHYHHYGQ